MSEQFVSCGLEEILVGEPLPGSLYLYIDFRFITFRAAGDVIDRTAFERLELKKIRTLFMLEKDRKAFTDWSQKTLASAPPPPLPRENQAFSQVRQDAHRKLMDIFQSNHPDRMVEQTLASSKNLVTEVMKFPFAVQTLAQLQTFSRGTVDHSVNVSILSVYLAMQMGYSHALILQHVGMGGLLHDVGKLKVKIDDNDSPEEAARKMQEHPSLGARLLEGQSKIPNEVRMIVEQHHECHDGTGYPKKLRGQHIYDLARIVTIANAFDELVGDGKGTLIERQRRAVRELDENLFKKFDPQKLEKALKILKLGI
ncbi:MAG: HD domain-containing protein [Oligoflexia bacterium]|nr:HD domain-containing protein [Oligoflexia bacterium]